MIIYRALLLVYHDCTFDTSCNISCILSLQNQLFHVSCFIDKKCAILEFVALLAHFSL